MAHHTPLRRVSQGSLSASASLSSSHPAPSTVSQTGLDFLAPALSDLVDEIEGLHANLLGIGQLSTSLGVFNEGFAGFLYGLRMNAFSVEWPQVSELERRDWA
jgi:DASH complex subunit DAM1